MSYYGQKVANNPLGSFAVLANKVDGSARQLVQIDIGVDGVSTPLTSAAGFPISPFPTGTTHMDLGYTGANLTSVIYKAGSTVLRTLTLGYTGSDLTSVDIS